MKPFPPEIYLEVLQKLVADPPSDRMIAPALVKIARDYVARPDATDAVGVWNVYKEILDLGVHTSGLNGQMMALLDLEPFYTPPSGAYAQADGSIRNAPWRQRFQS